MYSTELSFNFSSTSPPMFTVIVTTFILGRSSCSNLKWRRFFETKLYVLVILSNTSEEGKTRGIGQYTWK